MAQERVFPAASAARRSISRRAYVLFGIGVALLICGVSTGAVSFANSDNPARIVIGLAGGLACAGSAGLIAGIVTLMGLQKPIQVEVTPHRLLWREGGKIATMEFDNVVRVELVKDTDKKRGGFVMQYPVVRFIESDGSMMEFEVTFEDRGFVHKARFDARSIANEVLRHLPPHVVTSPTLEEFLHSGEVEIDLLPER